MLIFALVGFALLVFCFTQTKERVVMDEKETKNVKVSDLWTEFFHNRPLRIVALFFITAFAMTSVGNAARCLLYERPGAAALLWHRRVSAGWYV